uniref:FBD domain-containing protein n=1 Tax=Panagrellus redivivus TaxID=6233 RepID=A0A7E4VWW0_PANRE
STARFGPEQSTFNKISPYFSKLLQRYMPDVITNAGCKNKKLFVKLDIVDDDPIEELPLSSSNRKAVVIIRSLNFKESIAGTLSKYYQKRVFWMYETSCFGSSFTPAELVYLAKHTKKSLRFYLCSLTETVSFSAIWPCIKHLDSIDLNVKNLDVGEDIKETLLYKPCEFSADCF